MISSVLSREAMVDMQRWELPAVGDVVRSPASPVEPDKPSPPTVFELEALENEARAEGYASGREEGLAAAKEALQARLGRLDALFDAAARPLDALDDAMELELAGLAMVVARRVIAHELALSPELIVQAVRLASRALPSATRELRVRLHPDDVALLRELDACETHWQLVADPSLARGDCLLESERSRLDARVDTRLAAMVDAVLGAEAASDDDGDDEVTG